MAITSHAATALVSSPAAAQDLEYALEALLFMASEPLGLPELVRLLQQGESEIVATLRRLTRRYAKRGIRVKEQSDAAYEVLALVAYLQPITAGRLVELQGTDGRHVLQTLQDAGLIVSALGEESGLFFRTTEAFLEAVELDSLEELPLANLVTI